MTKKIVFRVLGIVLLSCLVTLNARGADEDEWIGKRVMVVKPNVNFQVSKTMVGPAPIGMVLDVTEVNGKWLKFKGKRGWIQIENVILQSKAVEHFSNLIRANPGSEAYNQRGVAWVAQQEYDKAIADFDEAIRRDSKNISAFNDRGNAYRKLGKLSEALADFNKVVASGIRHPAVYLNRGFVLHDKGDYDAALADFNLSLKVDAKFAPAWEAGGSARQAKGEYDWAISNFNKAIEADDTFALAYNNLAWILATCPDDQIRDAEKAFQHGTKACELTGFQNAEFLDTLAAAHAEAGQFEQAVQHAKQAVELAKTDKKGEIAERLKHYEENKPFREGV